MEIIYITISGMWAAASSRSSVKNHWARRPWEESANLRPISESHASYSSDDEDDVTEQRRKRLVSSQSMPESSSLPAGRTQRSMSVSSNSSVGSQSSVFSNSSTDEDPIFARGRSRKNSTQSRGRRASHGSTLASAVTPDSDCVLM